MAATLRVRLPAGDADAIRELVWRLVQQRRRQRRRLLPRRRRHPRRPANADSADPATIADSLTRADPPGDITDAYDNVLELYESLRDDPAALTDPANATRFADLNDDITAIDDYINENCRPDE